MTGTASATAATTIAETGTASAATSGSSGSSGGASETGGSTTTTTGGESSGASSTTDALPPEPIVGYADLHLHMMAEEAFGGGWLAGEHSGALEVALASCDGGFPGDHARLRSNLAGLLDLCQEQPLQIDLATLASMVPFLNLILFLGGTPASEFLGDIEGTAGDTGLHEKRKEGAPSFEGWPRWDTIAHQQAWEGWLKKAHDDGLRVVVMSAVSFDWLCRALPPGNLDRPECDEMADVLLQLEMANALAAEHDWLEIALSAAHAREIAGAGKLAMVLSIEASHIFGDDPWEPQLEQLHALGVRSFQLVHQLDNRFGGAAPHNAVFQVAQFTLNCHIDQDCGLTTDTLTLGFDVDEECRNTKGLTPEGLDLVDAMVERGMLIDAAHLSERSIEDLYDAAKAHDYYPIYVSHGHFREIMTPDKQAEEKTTPAWVIAALRETGGMFGLRTAHEETNHYGPGGVDNSCHGSSRSFAQAYLFGQQGLKVDVGFGTDFNGFIQQTRPRFGELGACSASFAAEAACQRRDQLDLGPPPVGGDLDTRGFAHVGLLGELVADLDQLGVDTSPLATSAESFIRMWERAEGRRDGPAGAAEDLDVDGVVIAPPKDEREAAYPKVCGTPYCPASLELGDSCSFDDECKSGKCSSGPCGIPKGTCK
ncbi:MAG: membrane dipeptidase [Myxococcales bacterium]|nr:membrane dipeptidase [Myxococcales bacterium]